MGTNTTEESHYQELSIEERAQRRLDRQHRYTQRYLAVGSICGVGLVLPLLVQNPVLGVAGFCALTIAGLTSIPGMAHSSKPTFALITLGMWTGGFLAFVLALLYVVFADLLTLAMTGAV
ncbi:hypothetical protein [Halorubrum laminariae]|uniref:Uncharacterized protein n=1 Tax=Halorubrum laminariae TaxID=1433523 RepID=A0ABD6BZ87_9EURY|nr:hypothetical protein [Halorubrum laminariae]